MFESDKKKRRRASNQRREDVNVAFHLDDLDGNQEVLPASSRSQRSSKASRKQADRSVQQPQQRKNKRNPKEPTELQTRKRAKSTSRGSRRARPVSKRRAILLVILAIFVLLQGPSIWGLMTAFRWQTFSTQSSVPGAKGILLLGVDDDDTRGFNGGHTDSITYIAANFNANKGYALPIYRDTNIPVVCDGTHDNINRIYGQSGMKCLVESTAAFLELPLDYYALITMEGVIAVIDAIGGISLVASETFCSDYGEDGITYCFEYGNSYDMKGPESLAYIRYRGAGSGESRANRQMELIMGVKNTCFDHLFLCYARAAPAAGGALQTNVPIFEVLQLAQIFGDDFELEQIPVIYGDNRLTETGWSLFIDEYDLAQKTEMIRTNIFSP